MTENAGLAQIRLRYGPDVWSERLTEGSDRIRHMFYSSDGPWLYFQPNHPNIYRMPAAGGPAQQVTHFPESGLFIEEPTISPDDCYLVYCRSNGGSSLWLLKIGTARSGSNEQFTERFERGAR